MSWKTPSGLEIGMSFFGGKIVVFSVTFHILFLLQVQQVGILSRYNFKNIKTCSFWKDVRLYEWFRRNRDTERSKNLQSFWCWAGRAGTVSKILKASSRASGLMFNFENWPAINEFGETGMPRGRWICNFFGVEWRETSFTPWTGIQPCENSRQNIVLSVKAWKINMWSVGAILTFWTIRFNVCF